MRQIVQEAVARQKKWQLKDSDTSWTRFRPIAWGNFKAMDTGLLWPSGALLLCQLFCNVNNSHFYLTLASGTDQIVREKIFETVKQSPHLFNGTNQTFSDGSKTIHQQENILDDSDLNNWDEENAPGPAKLRAWVKNFAENQFPAMNEVIVNCLREYEAEAQGQ